MVSFQQFHKQPKVSRSCDQQKWSHPPSKWLKCNFDGAWSKKSSRGGVGVVIRDHNGNFLAKLSASVDHATSPLQVEFLAARRAILFVLELFPDIRPFCFEGDSTITLAVMQLRGVDT
ncbi:hypothetical protein ACFX2G_009600 [Malus domestica]